MTIAYIIYAVFAVIYFIFWVLLKNVYGRYKVDNSGSFTLTWFLFMGIAVTATFFVISLAMGA